MTLLDMPLGAVREMIPRLEAGGLIKTVPQRGLQIAHVDLKLIRNAFQVRAMIEREAMLHFVHSASDENSTPLKPATAILRRASAQPDQDRRLLDDAQAMDWGLHDRMVDALGNDIVSEMYRVNSLRVRLIKLEHSVITPARLIPAMQEHLLFITALQARDVVQGSRACCMPTSRARAPRAVRTAGAGARRMDCCTAPTLPTPSKRTPLHPDIHGLWPALLIPVTADSAVDTGRAWPMPNACWTAGCDGVTLFGTTGEGPAFTVAERKGLLDGPAGRWRARRPDRRHHQRLCLPDAIELGRHASSLGCHRQMFMPPFYFPPAPDAGIIESVSQVVRGIGDPAQAAALPHPRAEQRVLQP
jgi:DNA-binding GntR family transcriptional regulator